MYLVVLEDNKGNLEMWNAKAFTNTDNANAYAVEMNKAISHKDGTYIIFRFNVEG